MQVRRLHNHKLKIWVGGRVSARDSLHQIFPLLLCIAIKDTRQMAQQQAAQGVPQGQANGTSAAPADATASLFVASEPVPDHFESVKGPDFEQEQTIDGLLSAFGSIGFQATGMAKAVEILEKMVSCDRVLTKSLGAPF